MSARIVVAPWLLRDPGSLYSIVLPSSTCSFYLMGQDDLMSTVQKQGEEQSIKVLSPSFLRTLLRRSM